MAKNGIAGDEASMATIHARTRSGRCRWCRNLLDDVIRNGRGLDALVLFALGVDFGSDLVEKITVLSLVVSLEFLFEEARRVALDTNTAPSDMGRIAVPAPNETPELERAVRHRLDMKRSNVLHVAFALSARGVWGVRQTLIEQVASRVRNELVAARDEGQSHEKPRCWVQ